MTLKTKKRKGKRKVKRVVVLAGILLIGAMLFACAPKVTPISPIDEKAAEVALPVEKEGWEAEWERTLSLSRKEGRLEIYTTIVPDTRVALVKEFDDRFGIKLDLIAGRPAELVEKILAQRRAGLFTADIYMTGAETAWANLKPVGALESPEKYLILPEVIDPKVWWGGQLIWMDRERTFLQFFAYPTRSYYINTDLVRHGEITSFKDLLNPKWKGKIVLGDPQMGGSPQGTLFHIVEFTLGWDYLRELAKQEPVILRDERQMVEWVARGKYPISIGSGKPAIAQELQELGLPIEALVVKEGTYLSQGSGAFTVLEKPPHPNAVKVFLNMVLTKEIQTLMSRTQLQQSARLDVPIDHLAPWQIRQPGEKYVIMTEELLQKRYEARRPMAEILGIK